MAQWGVWLDPGPDDPLAALNGEYPMPGPLLGVANRKLQPWTAWRTIATGDDSSPRLLVGSRANNTFSKMAVNSFLRIEIASLEGRAQSTRFRQNVLHSLHSALQSSEKLIKDAIRADTGHTDAEVTLEYVLTISELSKVYCDLSLEDELKNRRSTDNLSATTSLGIIYIIPSKQNLFYSAVSAVSAALAAGNCVVLEV